ncbi:MAG: glycosyltransferase family 2 protein [Candidatus Diapherotrites archaeon]|nr:glycosyltransferase family 2 protein [Candidatus Micrarchaeota archaeon]
MADGEKSAGKAKRTAIIIVNWNRLGLTRDCLNSLRKNTTYPNYEVIVVDNASSDGSVAALRKEFPWTRVIANSRNEGFAGANNRAFNDVRADYYFMLNNDTLLTKNWLVNAVKVMESDARIGVVGCEEVTNLPDFNAKKYGKCADRDVMTVSGATMLVRAEVLRKVGTLDAKEFSPAYGEETDLNYRAHNAGYRIVRTCKSSIMHFGGKSSEQLGSAEQYLLCNTNRIKVMLYNLGILNLIRHVPGWGLIFVKSVPEMRTHLLLRAAWRNLRNAGKIMRERRKRAESAKKLRQKLFGE